MVGVSCNLERHCSNLRHHSYSLTQTRKLFPHHVRALNRRWGRPLKLSMGDAECCDLVVYHKMCMLIYHALHGSTIVFPSFIASLLIYPSSCLLTCARSLPLSFFLSSSLSIFILCLSSILSEVLLVQKMGADWPAGRAPERVC